MIYLSRENFIKMSEDKKPKDHQKEPSPPPSYEDSKTHEPQSPTTSQTALLPEQSQSQSTSQPQESNQQHQPHMQVLHPETLQPLVYTIRDNIIYLPVRSPCLMFCPYDNRQVITKIKKRAGCLAYVSSFFLCLYCWPCFWLPFCCQSCKDDEHVCTQCGRTLGIVPA